MMFQMLLGHLVGDYLLQNEWMVLNKAKNTWVGWLSATLHCLIYACAVCLFMWNFSLLWFVVVFLTHFPIDKFRLAEHYNRYDVLEGGFTTFIYGMTDNTLHLVLMYLTYQIIY